MPCVGCCAVSREASGRSSHHKDPKFVLENPSHGRGLLTVYPYDFNLRLRIHGGLSIMNHLELSGLAQGDSARRKC